MRKIVLALLILLPALAFGATADPCQDSTFAKQSAVIDISSATTTELVASVTGKQVYVCAFLFGYTSGTSPTVKFEYGTKASAACDTGATAETGTMAVTATAGAVLGEAPGHTIFSVPAGEEVCVVSAGTAPTLEGVLTYVQP